MKDFFSSDPKQHPKFPPGVVDFGEELTETDLDAIGKYKEREIQTRGIYSARVLKGLPTVSPDLTVEAYLMRYDPNEATVDASVGEKAIGDATTERVTVKEAPDDPDEALIFDKKNLPAQTVKKSRDGTRSETQQKATSTVQKLKVKEPSKEAAPITEEEDVVWRFLANPERLSFSGRDPKYSEVAPHLAKVPYLHYSHTAAQVLEIKDLLLETWCEGKSVKPLLDGLNRLVEVSTQNGEFEPPTLSFIWGSRRFEPCKLTKISWEESRWLGGDPAGVRLSISLQQVPDPEAKPDNPLDYPLADETGEVGESGGLTEGIELTDRQLEEAREEARNYLEENSANYSSLVREILSGDEIFVTPSTDGTVRMYNTDKEEIGVIGQWTGEEFVTNGVGTIPETEEEEETSDDSSDS